MYEVKLPQTSDDSIESMIVFWHKSVGDTIKKGEILVEVQTEKAVSEIAAEEDGILKEILIPRGEVARGGETLATIESVSEKKEGNQALNPSFGQRKPNMNGVQNKSQFVRVLPRIRRLARDLGVNLSSVSGTGINGQITENDVRNAVHQKQDSEAFITPFNEIRKTIAKRMSDSLMTSAQLTETAWADVTELDRKRTASEKNFSWNDIVLYAVIKSLKQHSNVNIHVIGEEIRRYPSIHLGVAVDTEEGLFVPVIHHADRLSLTQLREMAHQLIEKTKNHQLSTEEQSGSTFTVTNLGSLGIQFFTPIINKPEGAILGVGQIESDIIMKDEQVFERKRLPLSLTFDHRAIDGAPAARFLQTVCQTLQHPEIIFEEMPV
ncbi:dihydrolipoamide acetyltransferase family protein [Cytobacillus sp. Hz8]|uniref:dihydrolipoamide acetyltransferase family protein n=1 Tax=Cytobacillus sp. Hz8 TaxID=3347168 RepID=UPI0035DA3810